MIQILPLGGGQDVGRSCIVVTIGGRTIMFDCGMHMGYNDERRFPDFTVLSKEKRFDQVIDLVIISHFHLDHCGGLPYFTEMCGYNGPILMTYPTKDICPILLEDFRKITVERRGEQNFFTSAMIQSCMNKVTAVDLSSEILIGEDIRVTAYYAGHVLGAAMFHVKVGEESVLYTGDYNMTPDRHLGAAVVDRCRPDVLITESTYAATVRDSKRARERDFLRQVHQCVANGGKVLVPTFALGRVQELCVLIDAYWTRAGLQDIPVYFTGGMAEMATKYYKNWIGWTSEGVQMNMITEEMKRNGNISISDNLDNGDSSVVSTEVKEIRVSNLNNNNNNNNNNTNNNFNNLRVPVCNPFDFKNIKPFEKSFADLPGPMLVFSTPGMLHSGISLEVFKKWCSDAGNLLIIPGYCVAGTVGAKVLAGHKSIEVQEVRVRGTNMITTNVSLPINLQVKNLSFSAHVDAKGILQLISQCRPKNVVLVHGEGAKMSSLRDRIVNTFKCPVYFPANGQVQFIETLPAAAGNVQISPWLWNKRRRDVAFAAQSVFMQASHLSDDFKSELLLRSASIQNRPELIDLSEGVLKSTKNEGLRMISPAEDENFDAVVDLNLSNYVKRFFAFGKLSKSSKNRCKHVKDDPIPLIHAFLLNHLHPQVNVVLLAASQAEIRIHSVELDEDGLREAPLVIISDFKSITTEHVEYRMQWCPVGESMAKLVIKLIKEELE